MCVCMQNRGSAMNINKAGKYGQPLELPHPRDVTRTIGLMRSNLFPCSTCFPAHHFGLAEEGSEGSGCSRTLENSLVHTAQAYTSKAALPRMFCSIGGPVFRCGVEVVLSVLKMWTGREQTIPRGQCVITWGPWEAIFCCWRNWKLCVCV